MNRLKNLREDSQLNQSDIAKKLNISTAAYSYYENEKRDIPTNVLKQLSEFFNCSIDYLLGKTDIRNNRNIDIKGKKIHMLPVYGRIAAGQPNWAEECIDGRIPVDPDLMDIVNPDECFFLRVNGESMNKEIRNGAYALIRKTDFVENGEIAVVLVNRI